MTTHIDVFPAPTFRPVKVAGTDRTVHPLTQNAIKELETFSLLEGQLPFMAAFGTHKTGEAVAFIETGLSDRPDAIKFLKAMELSPELLNLILNAVDQGYDWLQIPWRYVS